MNRKCKICDGRGNIYLPINPCFREAQEKSGFVAEAEMLNEKMYVCKYCDATDRDRMCATFFDRLFGKEDLRLRVLDIAPSKAIKKFFAEKYPFVTYRTADLFMDDVDYQLDIQDMKEVTDGQYDIVICCHVLEHVQDDRKAMREFYRILSEKGIGVFLVPIDLSQKEIDEEYGCDPEENIRRFGQADHVRRYSKNGFVDRLEESGFEVLQLDTKWFGRKETWENAFTKTATLYVVTKCKEYNKDNFHAVFAKNFPAITKSSQMEEINYSIDGVQTKADVISVWGWMLRKCSEEYNFDGVVVLKKKNEIKYRKRFSLKERPDVQKIYGKEYLKTGIEVEIPISSLKSGKYVLSFILLDGACAYEIDWKQDVEV